MGITIETIAKAFKIPLKLNLHVAKTFQTNFSKKIPYAYRKMSMFPKNATLIFCPETRAPGICINKVFCLAGHPRICHSMIKNIIKTINQEDTIYEEKINSNIKESCISLDLKNIQNKEKNIAIGSYPSYLFNNYKLSILLKSRDKNKIQSLT